MWRHWEDEHLEQLKRASFQAVYGSAHAALSVFHAAMCNYLFTMKETGVVDNDDSTITKTYHCCLRQTSDSITGNLLYSARVASKPLLPASILEHTGDAYRFRQAQLGHGVVAGGSAKVFQCPAFATLKGPGSYTPARKHIGTYAFSPLPGSFSLRIFNVHTHECERQDLFAARTAREYIMFL